MPTHDPYRQAIDSEGILRYYLAQLGAGDAAQQSAMRNQIAALQADYNGSGNPYSTVAQLARQRDSQRGMMKADRAARGVIQSGGSALQEADIGYDYGLQNYNAARGLSSQIAQLQQQYAEDARGRMGDQQGYYQDAMNRLMENGMSPQNVTPQARQRQIAGRNYGLGYYRSPNGLTYKAPPRRRNPIVRRPTRLRPLETFRGGH